MTDTEAVGIILNALPKNLRCGKVEWWDSRVAITWKVDEDHHAVAYPVEGGRVKYQVSLGPTTNITGTSPLDNCPGLIHLLSRLYRLL